MLNKNATLFNMYQFTSILLLMVQLAEGNNSIQLGLPNIIYNIIPLIYQQTNEISYFLYGFINIFVFFIDLTILMTYNNPYSL